VRDFEIWRGVFKRHGTLGGLSEITQKKKNCKIKILTITKKIKPI
jgi:hypothetical protein